MKLRSVLLDAEDPAGVGRFYNSLLALPVIETNDAVTVTIGETNLTFRKTDSKAKPFYHFAINIPYNKVEEARDWLLNKFPLIWLDDYKNDIAEFINWKARSVYFYDEAGNIVELIGRAELDNATSAPFTSKQFLCVSEIGIAFPAADVQFRTQSLINEYHLSYFDKQPPLPNFKAVGDDHGLFIIVPEGRNWYPTHDKPAGLFPAVFHFENHGRSYCLQLE